MAPIKNIAKNHEFSINIINRIKNNGANNHFVLFNNQITNGIIIIALKSALKYHEGGLMKLADSPCRNTIFASFKNLPNVTGSCQNPFIQLLACTPKEISWERK